MYLVIYIFTHIAILVYRSFAWLIKPCRDFHFYEPSLQICYYANKHTVYSEDLTNTFYLSLQCYRDELFIGWE